MGRQGLTSDELIQDLITAAVSFGQDGKGKDLVISLRHQLQKYVKEVERLAQTEHILPKIEL